MARRLCICAALVFLITSSAFAQTAPRAVTGTVFDPLGAPVSGATVTLLRDGERVTDARTDAEGKFNFAGQPEGRYSLEARAEGFAARTGDPFFLAASGRVSTRLTLQISGVEQRVVVTASASESPVSQTGASVSVIDRELMDTLAKPDVLEALRLVPGASVIQTGARGGRASVFIRGGASNFNKVLMNGVPANDIGGNFDFGDVAVTGVERVEMLRNANSVLYGSDALAGVISLTTRRGRTRIPELAVSFDAGNLGTHREEVSFGGAAKRVDYFAAFSQYGTDNKIENNTFDNKTFASRVGVQVGNRSDVSFTVRHTNSEYGTPNSFNFFGIADDSVSKSDATYVGASFESTLNDRWRATAQFASMEYHSTYVNPAPSGIAYDPFGFGADYLGKSVTIQGANGYSVTGQGILDFGYGGFPSSSFIDTSRRAGYGHVTGRVTNWLDLSGGARVEREDGVSDYSGSGGESTSDRTNAGVFAEASLRVRRVFATGGIGYDHHDVYESAWTPRLSVAAYLRDPSTSAAFGETKLTLNAGRGVKSVGIAQELSSLFTVVSALPSATRPSIAGLSPIGPERNRSFDVGVEQGLWGGRARARAAFFHNQFSDLVEYFSPTAQAQLGIPTAVANATGFGAYVNSSSYRARGVELSADVTVGSFMKVMASYTHLDAVVTESFTSGALGTTNPAFPSIKIGAYGPIEGARPFRRPANSGNLLAAFTRGRAQIALAAYVAGKSDDSTFLSDQFYGNSLLLPNHDLNPAYQKVDLSGSYRLHDRVRWYASIENLLDQAYSPSFGFPALPATIRTGLSVTLGGDARRP